MTPGEIDFLDWLRRTAQPDRHLSVPLGDDAAVWRLPSGQEIVLTADALAEGTHFEPGADPRLVGRKALAVNLSDLAAMGAAPLCALATCALPAGFDDSLPRLLTEGMRALAEDTGCPLVGGDTVSHGGGVVLSVSVLGVPCPGGPITRAGARPDDVLVVTGRLGGSRRGRHLRFQPRLTEARRLLELGPPSAMLDVSDGLLLDLHRLADASRVGFRLDAETVPIHADARERDDPLLAALGDGEDFELLASLPRDAWDRVREGWDLETPLTVIGRVLPPPQRLLRSAQGEQEALRMGYEHR